MGKEYALQSVSQGKQITLLPWRMRFWTLSVDVDASALMENTAEQHVNRTPAAAP